MSWDQSSIERFWFHLEKRWLPAILCHCVFYRALGEILSNDFFTIDGQKQLANGLQK
jgi:hypothetical protein